MSYQLTIIYGQAPEKKSFKNETDVEREKEEKKKKNKGRNEGLLHKNK